MGCNNFILTTQLVGTFQPKDYTWEAFDTVLPCTLENHPAGDKQTQLAATELTADPSELVWLSLPVPKFIVPGVVEFKLMLKRAGTIEMVGGFLPAPPIGLCAGRADLAKAA